MSTGTYGYTEARTSLKAILDITTKGGLASIRRNTDIGAVVNGEKLRTFLAKTISANAQVVNEDGAWAVFIPGLPLAVEATKLDDALLDMVHALREYAEDWVDHLSKAPNHSDNWGLVQLVMLADDQQLIEWLVDE